MQETLREGLADGALGVGLPLQYQPGASRSEIYRMFQTAAEAGVTVFRAYPLCGNEGAGERNLRGPRR